MILGLTYSYRWITLGGNLQLPQSQQFPDWRCSASITLQSDGAIDPKVSNLDAVIVRTDINLVRLFITIVVGVASCTKSRPWQNSMYVA